MPKSGGASARTLNSILVNKFREAGCGIRPCGCESEQTLWDEKTGSGSVVAMSRDLRFGPRISCSRSGGLDR